MKVSENAPQDHLPADDRLWPRLSQAARTRFPEYYQRTMPAEIAHNGHYWWCDHCRVDLSNLPKGPTKDKFEEGFCPVCEDKTATWQLDWRAVFAEASTFNPANLPKVHITK